MKKYYWIQTPAALKSVSDPEKTGVWLEALSETVGDPLTPAYIVDAYKACRTKDSVRNIDRSHESPTTDAQRWRILQACQMVLCLGVKDQDDPEWLRKARDKARERLTDLGLESGDSLPMR